jgi:RNA polymerase sigma-32 factor
MTYLLGLSRDLMKAAKAANFLERGEEKELAIAWRERGDGIALNKLTESHMRLVISMASRFRHYGLSIADLVQEGHVGLMQAAARFDPSREVRFSTYATWWIRASIQDYVLRNWSIVRGGTSSGQKALFFNLRGLRAKLAQGGKPIATADAFDAIARATGANRSDVEMMNSRLSGFDVSLNAPIPDDNGGSSERMDFLVDSGPLPDDMAEEAIDMDRRTRWLRDALAVLNERELRIVSERRLNENVVTLEALGRTLGISKERVRQIESHALGKMRLALTPIQGSHFVAEDTKAQTPKG